MRGMCKLVSVALSLSVVVFSAGTAAIAVVDVQVASRPSKKPTAAASAWRKRRLKSEMDDTPGVAYVLTATNTVTGWLKTSRPTLIIRCQEKHLQAYIDFGMGFSVESGDTRTVRVRFDEQPATTEYWDESTDNEALFADDPGVFTRNVLKSRLLRVQFTPFNASPQLARFNLAGFDRHYADLATLCPDDVK